MDIQTLLMQAQMIPSRYLAMYSYLEEEQKLGAPENNRQLPCHLQRWNMLLYLKWGEKPVGSEIYMKN